MDELLKRIIAYAKEHPKFSAPEMQYKLHIGYREFVDALKDLQEKGEIKFVGGSTYEYTPAPEEDNKSAEEDGLTASRREYLERRKQEILQQILRTQNEDEEEDAEDSQNESEEEYTFELQNMDEEEDSEENQSEIEEEDFADSQIEGEEDEEDNQSASDEENSTDSLNEDDALFRERLEQRKQEIIQRILTPPSDGAKTDNGDLKKIFWADESNKKTTDPMALDVLYYSVTVKAISIPRIQRKFGLGYPRAAKLFCWMEVNGFIESTRTMPRKVLLTHKGFGKVCAEYGRKPSEFKCEVVAEEFALIGDKAKTVIEKAKLNVIESGGRTFIHANGLGFSGGGMVKFSISDDGTNMILCDEGLFNEKLKSNTLSERRRIDKFLKKYGGRLLARMDDDGKVNIRFYNIYELPQNFYYLYWLIESVSPKK